MNEYELDQMVKEAYAYGASLAYAENGYDVQTAEYEGIKLASAAGEAATAAEKAGLLSRMKGGLSNGWGHVTGGLDSAFGRGAATADTLAGRAAKERALVEMEGAVPGFVQRNPYAGLAAGAGAGAALGAGGLYGGQQLLD